MSPRFAFSSLLLLLALPASAHTVLERLGDVRAVSTGGGHACAVSNDGVASCWGANRDGQLGDGSTRARSLPAPVVGLPDDIATISAGATHTCAVTTGGDVWCWGSAELGNGVTRSELPQRVTALTTPVAKVSAGTFVTCVVTTAGAALCWGANAQGQLGDGTTTDRPLPTPVATLGSGVADISASIGGGAYAFFPTSGHTCAVLTGGSLRCWGSNGQGELGDGTYDPRLVPTTVSGMASGVTQVEAGGMFTCAVQSGAAKCWGYGAYGQLGTGARISELEPAFVTGLGTVDRVAVGWGHACAVSGAATYCWGWADDGELGNGASGFFVSPQQVQASPGFAAVDVGQRVTCGLRADGGVACFGYNGDGNLGDGTRSEQYVPREVALVADAEAVSVGGGSHTCAIDDGTLRCWGANPYGQLGTGAGPAHALLPQPVIGIVDPQQVSAGTSHTCAIDAPETAYCWGLNETGQLGDGTAIDRATPVAVGGLGAALQVASGELHSCALLATRAVMCWGSNEGGALGTGGVDSLVPVAVSGLPQIRAISAHGYLTCALGMDGSIWCWGGFPDVPANNGSTVAQPVPMQIAAAGSGASQISTGAEFMCAAYADGSARCWGRNFEGQLGDGTNDARAALELVQGLSSGVASVAAGHRSACAVRTDGSATCWGTDALGRGSRLASNVPVPVSGLQSGVAAISIGYHACALLDSARIACWGANGAGQLGIGGRNYAIPDAVSVDPVRPRIASPSLDPAALNKAAPGRKGLPDGESIAPVGDRTGRYVVFQSDATNLTAQQDLNASTDIFRVDANTGATVRVSVGDDGSATTGPSFEPAVSGDGHLVAFVAADSAVPSVAGESPVARAKRLKGPGYGVFLRNLLTSRTARIGTATQTGSGTLPQVAPNGGAIVYTGINTNPALGTVGQQNVFKVPLLPNGTPAGLECVSCKARSPLGAETGNSDGESRNASVSADGMWITYETLAKNTIAGTPSPCAGATTEVMLRNLLTGATQRISPPAGLPAPSCGAIGSGKPSMDWIATRIVIETDASLSPLDFNTLPDVYLFDLADGTYERLSEDPRTGHDGLGASGSPRISGNGRQVAFLSDATNVESSEPDDNDARDVLVYAMEQRLARRISTNGYGEQARAASDRPALSYDGSVVLFDSTADNLLVDPSNGQYSDANASADVFRAYSPFNTKGGPNTIFHDGFEGE